MPTLSRPIFSSSGSVIAPEAMMSPWISRPITIPARSASSAIAPMLARNAASFSSADWCPPTAVLTIGIPYSAAQRTALIPCASPSGVVRSECAERLTGSSP